MGTKIKLSTTCYPQMDGQAECTNQTLEDMITVCIIDFTGNWYNHLPLVEFVYKNSYNASISMLLIKPCMVRDVEIKLGGLKWVSLQFWVPI